MRRPLIGAAVACAVIALAAPAVSAETTAPPARTHWMRTPCAQEDSLDCQWNAGTSGNGAGHSFYRVKRAVVNAHGRTVGRVVCVYYVTHADARKWDACHLLPAGENGSLS